EVTQPSFSFTMFKDYKGFCDNTPARDISFRAFLTALDDNREKHQEIGFWTGAVIPYLEKHDAIDKRQRAAFLKKSISKALEATVDEVFETWKCIDALVQNEVRKTEVADVMAIIGVSAPSMSTRRMEEMFSKKLLYALTKPTVELPDMDFDDSAMMKAVRYLPPTPANSISENAFVAKYVAPIIQVFVDDDVVKSDFPNTESTTQKDRA
ncbi:hypothetical protein BGX30_004523, partial [Mortierella sp. GBA39]